MKPAEICKRYETLKASRQNVEQMWKWMEQFVMPYRAELYGTKTEDGVNWRKRDIYDSTAPEAADALAASLQGNLISPSVKWFDLTFSDHVLNEDDAAQEWLEECSQSIFLALQQSDFNLEAAEALLDLVGYGTMALIEEVDEETGQLDFTAVPIHEVYFEVGARGQTLRFYRKLEWTALQILDKFGENNLPDQVAKALENDATADKKFDIIFCIYKRMEIAREAVDTSKPVAQKAMPFGHKYIFATSKEQLGEEGGYSEMPAFITRWRTTASSIWGNAPGFKILATIMDVNEAVEITLEKGASDVEPPLMTTQRGIISDLDRRRGGLTVVADVSGIAELPGRGDAELELISVGDMRQQIRRAFYEDQLELKESPAMTATEVNVRYELMQRLLGPTMGRLKTDFLDPLIMRTFFILYRLGKLPPPPEIVKERQAEFDVEYTGPLPRAQKADVAHSTAGWLGSVGSMAELNPEVMDVPDWDAAVRGIGELSGVPAKYMRSENEIKQLRDDRQAKIEKQQRIENLRAAGEAGQAIGNAAQALPPEAIPAIQGAING